MGRLSLPDVLAAALGVAALALAARMVVKVAPDLWVLINGLAQPSR
ncbi:MAG: hypothetical protein ACTHMG_11150 [Sphingomonas sp.]